MLMAKAKMICLSVCQVFSEFVSDKRKFDDSSYRWKIVSLERQSTVPRERSLHLKAGNSGEQSDTWETMIIQHWDDLFFKWDTSDKSYAELLKGWNLIFRKKSCLSLPGEIFPLPSSWAISTSLANQCGKRMVERSVANAVLYVLGQKTSS